jgi:hypothetical protein
MVYMVAWRDPEVLPVAVTEGRGLGSFHCWSFYRLIVPDQSTACWVK